MQLFRVAVSLVVVGTLVGAESQQKTTSSESSKPAASAQTTYRNSAFGFRYRIPYGWVERTNQMQNTDSNINGQVLLAIFERPPQASSDSVNSAVVIASEPAESYRGMKIAEDYLGPLTAVTKAKGFVSAGDPSEVTIDGQRLVRADFSKTISAKLAMWQSTLVLLRKGQVLSFTFIAETPDEVDGLIEGLDFQAAKSGSR